MLSVLGLIGFIFGAMAMSEIVALKKRIVALEIDRGPAAK